ncbi:hypothetical protein C8R45DRAFT_440196 [Mycena sanguinolenta]|nr:hypothetical protein C8R45DRAFT_440196 [Mycena sanguinolenta]
MMEVASCHHVPCRFTLHTSYVPSDSEIPQIRSLLVNPEDAATMPRLKRWKSPSVNSGNSTHYSRSRLTRTGPRCIPQDVLLEVFFSACRQTTLSSTILPFPSSTTNLLRGPSRTLPGTLLISVAQHLRRLELTDDAKLFQRLLRFGSEDVAAAEAGGLDSCGAFKVLRLGHNLVHCEMGGLSKTLNPPPSILPIP